MAASVTVHHKALADERIGRLAELAGYNRHEALGRMTLLWSVCTELQTEGVLTRARIRACLGDCGDDHLIEAELGEALETGDVRVKGCDGRIEWFGEQQEGRSAGGKARVANAPRAANGRLLKRTAGASKPAGHQQATSSNQLSESDQDPKLPESDSEEITGVRAHDELPLPPYQPLRDVSRSPEQSLEHDLHESKQRFATAGKLGGGVWERLREMRKAIAAELGVEVRDLHPHDAGRRALALRIREAVDAKHEPERIGADLNHVLDVFVAEARLTKSVQWLTGGMFEDRSFRRALGMTLADVAGAARRSNGARGGPREPESPTPNLIRAPAWGDHEVSS